MRVRARPTLGLLLLTAFMPPTQGLGAVSRVAPAFLKDSQQRLAAATKEPPHLVQVSIHRYVINGNTPTDVTIDRRNDIVAGCKQAGGKLLLEVTTGSYWIPNHVFITLFVSIPNGDSLAWFMNMSRWTADTIVELPVDEPIFQVQQGGQWRDLPFSAWQFFDPRETRRIACENSEALLPLYHGSRKIRIRSFIREAKGWSWPFVLKKDHFWRCSEARTSG